MRIEALTAERAEEYRKEIAQFYFENVSSCSCFNDFTYDEAYEKIGCLVDHLTDYTAAAYGAFDGEKIIGFIWAYVHQFREERRMYVNEIRVKEDYRNKGIGCELLKLIEDKAKEQGIGTLYLHTEASNTEAICLYQKCGYIFERIQLRKEIAIQDNQRNDERT